MGALPFHGIFYIFAAMKNIVITEWLILEKLRSSISRHEFTLQRILHVCGTESGKIYFNIVDAAVL